MLSDRRYLPWVLGTLLLAAVVAIGFVFWLDRDDPDPPATASPVSSFPVESPDEDEPTSSPVIIDQSEATAEASPEVNGTPVAAEPRTGSLPDLLRYAPDRLTDDQAALPTVVTYADLERWSSSGLIDASPDEVAQGLALPPVLASHGNDPEWTEAYGFDLHDVSQVLAVGQSPDHVTILRGAFDAEELQSTWVRSGYQAIDVEGTTVWSLFPNDWIDLTAPASRPALGNMNNLVILEDGTLVAAAKVSRLTDVLQVVNGDAASLDEYPDVAALLLAEPQAEDMVTATIVQGEVFASVPTARGLQDGNLETLIRWGLEGSVDLVTNEATALPPIELALIGVRGEDMRPGNATPSPAEGDAPAATQEQETPVTFVFVMETPEEADTGMDRMIERLETGTSPQTDVPYADTLLLEQVRALAMPDGLGVIVLHAGVAGDAGAWVSMLETRDVGFAEWLIVPDEDD